MISHILGYLEPSRNSGTIKTNIFHLDSHVVQMCHFPCPKTTNSKHSRHLNFQQRLIEFVSPLNVVLFLNTSLAETNAQIMKLNTEKVKHGVSDLVLNWDTGFLLGSLTLHFIQFHSFSCHWISCCRGGGRFVLGGVN